VDIGNIMATTKEEWWGDAEGGGLGDEEGTDPIAKGRVI
jgi:hypothetical protein